MFFFKRELVWNRVNQAVRFPKIQIALQPIVSLTTRQVYAYEALCRGANGESYPELIARHGRKRLGDLDRLCAAKALRLAAQLGVTRTGAKISINMRPSMDDTALNIQYVLRAAQHYRIPMGQIILELTEEDKVSGEDLRTILTRHKMAGVSTAIDDFGAGYAGLNLMAAYPPELLKIDRELVRGIDTNEVRQTIVQGFVNVCHKLGTSVIAEGVETREECEMLRRIGIDLMQGYLFSRPVLNSAPVPVMDFVGDAPLMPLMMPAIAV